MASEARRRLPAAQRREALLTAAERTFARCGYHGASLDEVAEAAGVSKALIYEHFPSKRALHATLLRARGEEAVARLEAGAALGETREQRLRGGIDAFLAFVEDHRDAWRALLRDAAEPETAALLGRMQVRAVRTLAALLRPGAAAGGAPAGGSRAADRDVQAEIDARLLAGAVQSLATWWDEHRGVERRVLVERAMELCRAPALRTGDRPRGPQVAAALAAQAPPPAPSHAPAAGGAPAS